MGRLLTAGAETNDLTTEGTAAATGFSIQSSVVRSGSFAFAMTGNSGIPSFSVTTTLGRTYFARVYFRVTSLANTVPVVLFYDTGPNQAAQFRVNTDGSVTLATGLGATVRSTSATGLVTVNTWYRAELSILVATGAGDAAEVRLDGVSLGTFSGSITDAAVGFMRLGNLGVGDTLYSDDIALNDDQGASQNTWPGDGKEVLLKPVTDSATGTGWTLGTGTAAGTAVHTAVANTPPLGVADLTAGSDVKQVRNASANANVNIDQNMTTYTAAGIVAADTINLLDPIVATGAPVVTSAKAGTVGVVSNPAITNVALGAGGTAGAFWSGVAAGTYPTGWKVSHGTLTYAPSVTVGTAPVMRVQQVTSSTRIAIVSFMGIYVDYTPAVAAQIPFTSSYPQLLPQ